MSQESPLDLVRKISNRIINEVDGVNRVVLDVSSKPPSTIEREFALVAGVADPGL